MHNFIKNNSGKIPFKTIIISLIVIFVVTSLVIWGWQKINNKKINQSSNKILDIHIPINYTQPLVIATFNNFLSIQPVKANSSKMIKTGANTIKYIEAYENTDVEQIQYPTKLKESLTLKNKNHPERFEYKIDISKYDVKKNNAGDFIFYEKGKKGQELYQIFTIPAPFMIDADGKNSGSNGVETVLTKDGVLVLEPRQDWLSEAKYPVVLDPTVEINILNLHSHPQQGDDWEVNFTTQGKADLKIIPADQATIDDDEFVGLFCGKEKMNVKILDDDVIYYKNWECDSVGKVIHYTKKAGKHTLRFEFGDQIAWAYNSNGLIVESGEVDIDDSLEWTEITFTNTYNIIPVILATPVSTANCPGTCSGTSAGNGGMYPIPLVRNVSLTGFEISMCVDGGSATCSTGMNTETFHWFAFDAEEAANYDWIEVGTTTDVATNGSDTNETYTTSFAATPHVWTQAQTYSQGGEIGAQAWVDDNGETTSGFTYVGCVHTGVGNVCDSNNPAETFGYVAIDTANEAFDASLGFQTGMADISNSAWTAATFSPSFTNPRVMVTQNDDDGGQDPEYAWAQDVTGSGMDFRYCEEDAGNVCNTHTSEKTYWFAIEQLSGNTTPSITLVSDTPDPVIAGSKISFSTTWSDAGDQVKVKICKTNVLANQNCSGGFWASSTAFTTSNPEVLTYSTQIGDVGPQNYWAFVCDDEAACSTSSTGGFIVKQPNVKFR